MPQARVLQGTTKFARPRARGNVVDPPWMIQNSPPTNDPFNKLPWTVMMTKICLPLNLDWWMRDARLGVDPIHHCIVCVECAYALPLSNILCHFKDKHSPALLPNNFAQILEQNGVPERAVKPSKAVAPIDGINVVQGWCCAQPGCNAAYTEKGTLCRMHLDPVHQGQRDFATCCSVQVVYKQPNIETWQVNYLLGAAAPSNNVHVQDYMQDYLRCKHAEEATISAIQPPLDDCQLSPFFQCYPWLHMSKGLKPQAMHELVALPGTKHTLIPFRQHVNQSFQCIS